MNTNFNVLALAAALLSAPAVVNANPVITDPVTETAAPTAFSVNAYRAVNSASLRVLVKKHTPAAVTITLRNAKGLALFEDRMGKKESMKALSLIMSEQPDGEYTLDVRSGAEKVTKSFTFETPKRTLALN